MTTMLHRAAAATVLGLACHGAQASAYSLTILDAPAGSRTYATGINNAGEVVGHYEIPGFQPSYSRPEAFQAAAWRNGVRTDLQALPSATNYVSSYAWDISNTGQILGSSNFMARDTGVNSDILSHPVIWNPGAGPTDLTPLAAGSFYDPVRVAPTGINAHGSISAITDVVSITRYRATVIDGAGNMTVLGPDDISSQAHDINDAGTVGGSYNHHPAVWINQQLTVLPDLGYGSALAINELGHLAGETREEGDYIQQAAMWVDGQLIELQAVDNRHSRALGLNNLDQAVGVYEGEDLLFHAALWDGGQLIDLTSTLGPDSPWRLIEALDINDAGQIVGWALPRSGEGAARGFLLSPVPEPATWATMLLGLGALGWLRRRHCASVRTPTN